MPDTRKKHSSYTSEVSEDKEEYITKATLKHIMDTQEKMFKSFIDSILSSMNSRVDGLVNTVAELKSSLEFTQKDVDELKDTAAEINSVQQDIQAVYGSLSTQSNKMEYLENQSRRNNIRVLGIPENERETWDETETKVKEALRTQLKIEATVEIERAHRVGRRDLAPRNNSNPPRPRAIICKLKDWKQKEQIVKTARKAKVKGLLIFDDIAAETRRKQLEQKHLLLAAKEQGKTAYFVLDKLVIKNKNTNSTYDHDHP